MRMAYAGWPTGWSGERVVPSYGANARKAESPLSGEAMLIASELPRPGSNDKIYAFTRVGL